MIGNSVNENVALRQENERLRATLLNIQALAERGFPIDAKYLSMRCRNALEPDEQRALNHCYSDRAGNIRSVGDGGIDDPENGDSK